MESSSAQENSSFTVLLERISEMILVESSEMQVQDTENPKKKVDSELKQPFQWRRRRRRRREREKAGGCVK